MLGAHAVRFAAAAVVCLAAAALTLVRPGAALADVVKNPPVATNFQTRIVSTIAGVSASGVRVKVVDGDRQLWLQVRGATIVSIRGAEGEPLLLFDRVGVFMNVRSLTAVADRIGHFRPNPDLNPRAPPAWRRLTGGHSYLWHDHRLHALEPLAQGHRAEAVVGRWSIPISMDGRQSALKGELIYVPPGPLWPWLLVAGLLAAAVWLDLARSKSPAVRPTIAAALVATVVVWILRIARELYGRPEVGLTGYAEVGLTSVVGVVLLCGLLHRSADVRVFTALVVGLGALWEGLTMFRVLTHSVALTVLPTFVAQVGVAAALGLGAGLFAIVLVGLPEVLPALAPSGHRSTSPGGDQAIGPLQS